MSTPPTDRDSHRMEPATLIETPIHWEHSDRGDFPSRATMGDAVLLIRINDFPIEPRYTVLVDGADLFHLDGWPAVWTTGPMPRYLFDMAAALREFTAVGTTGADTPIPGDPVDAAALATWSRRLCAIPPGEPDEVVRTLGIADATEPAAGDRPGGTGRCTVGESGDGWFALRLTLTGAPVTRADLDRHFGRGTVGVPIDWDDPHPVWYRVEVDGAPFACDVLAYFVEPATAASIVRTVLLRRRPATHRPGEPSAG